jgi:hypothetical protein
MNTTTTNKATETTTDKYAGCSHFAREEYEAMDEILARLGETDAAQAAWDCWLADHRGI